MKIGELFMFGYMPGDFDFLRDFAQEHGLGGVILFERNLGSLDRISGEVERLKQAAGNQLIVSVDQEGGPVNRAKQDFPLFPSPRYYGDRADFDGIRTMARTTAKHLRALGINTNLVPVCDVLTNPDNILMRKRSFGENPEIVSKCILTLINEYHKGGVLCCAKHFPGLGSADIDPHKDISLTDIDHQEFEKTHWQPFKKAIAADVGMLMTTHIMANSLDPENMVTFSKEVVTNMLRGELGFKGVIITDDLNMGAISRNFSPEECGLESLRAGHDMILICHNKKDQETAFNSVLESYNNGRIDKDEIAAKVKRVKRLKEKLNKHAGFKKASV
jgi:beta-N-acetylhexosaminidase